MSTRSQVRVRAAPLTDSTAADVPRGWVSRTRVRSLDSIVKAMRRLMLVV